MFLESYVVPICLFDGPEPVHIKDLLGTAFYIGDGGLFITCKHVVIDAEALAARKGLAYGMCIKGEHGENPDNYFLPLEHFQHAPAPFDITIGFAPYRPKSPLKLSRETTSVWQDVATLGYPASATAFDKGGSWHNIRGLKGYVQRPTIPRDIHVGTHPDGYELSFLLSPGSSGSPIFKSPSEVVIGVAVGSYQTEQLDYEHLDVDDNGGKYIEKKIKIEQFGFCHNISGLLDWKPNILNGHSLWEAAVA